MAEAVENHSSTAESGQLQGVAKINSHSDTTDTIMKSPIDNAKTNSSGKPKREFTEQEKLKRKEYFKALKDSRAKKRQNFLLGRKKNSATNAALTKNALNCKMTDEDIKMLEFYQARLSTLRSENELLHDRLEFLVKENMRLLQMGPVKN